MNQLDAKSQKYFAVSRAILEIIEKEGQEIAFQKIKAEPVIIKLYYRFRGTSNPIGLVIKKYEKHWLDFMSGNLMRILNFDNQKTLNLSRTILTLRLGFYYRIATSATPDKDMAEAREALDHIHRQIF